ncbi:MAG: GAF domain-containing protein, partial [candidate division Zixibacteria bacterium]|nr:GAF domain-containing protein [candidate division Zixibacteria bacterium]
VGRVLESGQPMITAEVEETACLPSSDLAVAGGLQSVLAIPVTHRAHRYGVLTVGSRERKVFDRRHLQLLQSVMPVFADIMITDEHSRVMSQMQRRASVVDSFLNDVGGMEDLQAAFQRAAELIMSELDCSMVRVSTYNHDSVFLRSRAVAHDSRVEPTTPPDGHMVMSLMPLHRQVRDTGQVMLIGPDEDQALTAAEASQAFSGEAQGAMLVPIVVGHQVLAVIAVANAPGSDMFRHRRSDILLTRSVAGALGLAIHAGLSRSAAHVRDEDGSAKTKPPSSRLRWQVNSSLSGILGSLEMIKAQHKPGDPELDKYLSIIDKSAHRIHEYVTQPTQE